jgi:hypothetical protein
MICHLPPAGRFVRFPAQACGTSPRKLWEDRQLLMIGIGSWCGTARRYGSLFLQLFTRSYQRGGALAWQVFDATGNPTRAKGKGSASATADRQDGTTGNGSGRFPTIVLKQPAKALAGTGRAFGDLRGRFFLAEAPQMGNLAVRAICRRQLSPRLPLTSVLQPVGQHLFAPPRVRFEAGFARGGRGQTRLREHCHRVGRNCSGQVRPDLCRAVRTPHIFCTHSGSTFRGINDRRHRPARRRSSRFSRLARQRSNGVCLVSGY